MKKIKWALIGCGKVVLKNKTTPFLNKKNKIVAICTTNMESAINAKNKLNLKKCNCYTDINKMIKESEFDAIYICTPPSFHYEYLKKLSKYDYEIYVEKPFLTKSNQISDIKKLYKNKNNVSIAHYKRLTPKFQKLKKCIKKRFSCKKTCKIKSFIFPYFMEFLRGMGKTVVRQLITVFATPLLFSLLAIIITP